MTVDINNLSSKDLFELAKRKEKVEQEATQRVKRLAEVRKQKAQLIARHEETLAATDKAIRELQEKRTRLVSDFKTALTPIELDIQELERKVKADQVKASSSAPKETIPVAPTPLGTPVKSVPQQAAPASQPKTASSPTDAADSSEKLLEKIRKIMQSRSYISESLLKEKLKANGFDTGNLKQDIEKLIRDGKLEKKGPGNYALGKKK